jgi:hypothetical protein
MKTRLPDPQYRLHQRAYSAHEQRGAEDFGANRVVGGRTDDVTDCKGNGQRPADGQYHLLRTTIGLDCMGVNGKSTVFLSKRAAPRSGREYSVTLVCVTWFLYVPCCSRCTGLQFTFVSSERLDSPTHINLRKIPCQQVFSNCKIFIFKMC